ncbi:MAG TPA: hypothetical protein VM470_10070 [Acidimicrobiia bacterium]|nr:hypothetical protein [Acidimicrobiia bacterium]
MSIPIAETSPRRVFVWALGWPGWCRSGRDLVGALQALSDSQTRYVRVAERAGVEFPVNDGGFDIVSTSEGGGGTAFGVPSVITEADRQAVAAAEAGRLASLVAASWEAFDEVAAAAPEELTKGPRGGGRDTSRIIEHVMEADRAYAREIGLKPPPLDPSDKSAVNAMRATILEVLELPSEGAPLAGRKWPLRYAARRIAWHALDHAWEIEDRTPS